MARIRTVKPGFFTSEDICKRQPLARLLFEGLWCEADRDGYLADSPFQLKTRILPNDACNVDDLLWELASCDVANPLIRRFSAGGKNYIQILAFTEHQRPHPKEPKSVIPHAGEDRQRPAVAVHGSPRQVTGSIPSSPVGREGDLESGVQEGKGREREALPARRHAQSLIQPRDMTAFLEGPVFSIPQKWADQVIKNSNGALTEKKLYEFGHALFAKVEREHVDITIKPNRLAWLDEELREWRAGATPAAGFDKADAHIERVRKLQGARG